MGDDLSLYGRFKRIVAAGGVPQYYVGGNHDLDFDATDDAHSFDRLLVISAHIPFVTYTDATAQKHQVDNLDELYAIVADRPALGLSGHTHTTEQIEPGERFHASFNTPRFRRWAADLFAYVDLYGAPSDIPPPVTINDLGDMNLLTRADLRGGDDTAGFTTWRGVALERRCRPVPGGDAHQALQPSVARRPAGRPGGPACTRWRCPPPTATAAPSAPPAPSRSSRRSPKWAGTAVSNACRERPGAAPISRRRHRLW